MLRIHFTDADYAAVRLREGPDAMWEVLLSLHVLQQTDETEEFAHWRATVARELDPVAAGGLFPLTPPVGYSPDFLTPTGAEGFEPGLEQVLATPSRRMVRELGRLRPPRASAPYVRSLAAAEAKPLRLLGHALHHYHETALRPYWPHIRQCVGAQSALRSRVREEGGVRELLGGIHPAVRLHGDVLRVPYPGPDRDVHLGGRGLLLIPSFFCRGRPICLRDPELPPVLVHPFEREAGWRVPTRGDGRLPTRAQLAALTALLGRTRTRALAEIGSGCTTGELARRLRVSAAAASEHATALRRAGLVSTVRSGRTAQHALTVLGEDLLHQRHRPSHPRDPSATAET
ncbi:ArsR family transcriptional regulator [Streptomyces sp. NRRL S-340]|uniref:ArsR family transcriptional regulator n=1 Tax=Streptomyces sp. NRRL S-340 TaxID=1463901 RepID=UPI00055B5FB6|nr:ArsR family transcriptional regulator [Streptomyces sp. NRRL S-340]